MGFLREYQTNLFQVMLMHSLCTAVCPYAFLYSSTGSYGGWKGSFKFFSFIQQNRLGWPGCRHKNSAIFFWALHRPLALHCGEKVEFCERKPEGFNYRIIIVLIALAMLVLSDKKQDVVEE